MMLEIVIEGLNMNAVNSLIRASAILAKLAVVTTIVIGGIYMLILLGTFIDAVLG